MTTAVSLIAAVAVIAAENRLRQCVEFETKSDFTKLQYAFSIRKTA